MVIMLTLYIRAVHICCQPASRGGEELGGGRWGGGEELPDNEGSTGKFLNK